MEPFVELHGLDELDVFPSAPSELSIPAEGVLHGTWKHLSAGRWNGRPVLIKRLPFPGRYDTVRNPEWDAWRKRNSETIIEKIKEFEAVDPQYVLEPLGYLLDETPSLIVGRTKGGNILQYVTKHPQLSLDSRIYLLLGAARCVAHLHNNWPPITHGSIHPTQFVFSEQLKPILFDSGIVHLIRSLEPPPSSASITATIPRSPYNGPEILRGSKITPETDVFAFAGVILAVMSGRHPHWTHLVPEVAWLSGMPSPSDHPALPQGHPLWSFMRLMWQSEKSARPSMNQVVFFLENLVRNYEPEFPELDDSPPRFGDGALEIEVQQDSGRYAPIGGRGLQVRFKTRI